MVRVAAAIAILLAATPLQAAVPRLLSPIPIASGLAEKPLFTFAADFTTDGRIDLLVASQKEIRVLPGRGNGTFGAPVITQTTGFGAAGIADFNGDGLLDVYSSNRNARQFAILTGFGNGRFSTPWLTSTPAVYDVLTAADLDGDGVTDIVSITNGQPGAVRVFLNHNGGFDPPIERTVPSVDTRFATTGDFDDDGRMDIALSGWVVWNEGNGRFDVEEWSRGAQTVMAVDFTGDGVVDLVVDNGHPFLLWIKRGQAASRVLERPELAFYGRSTNALHARDMNGDGRLDIVTVSAENSVVGIALGRTEGEPEDTRFFFTGTPPENSAVADVTGDGKPDIVFTSGEEPDAVFLIPGNGDGTLRAPRAIDLRAAAWIYDRLERVAVMDVTGDGRSDIVGVDSHGILIVLASNRHGDFVLAPYQAVQPFDGTLVPAGDLDGDGHDDVIFTYHITSTNWTTMHGQTDGTFRRGATITAPSIAELKGVLDLTGDGKADLLDSSGRIYPGDGRGGFTAPLTTVIRFGDYPPFFGDVDGNRMLDVFSSWGFVYLNQGGGDFRKIAAVVPGIYALGDMNGDGRTDLVAYSSLSSAYQRSWIVGVKLANGDGTFSEERSVVWTPPVWWATFPGPGKTADFDGDGHMDLASGTNIFLGNGDGTFRTANGLPNTDDLRYEILDVARVDDDPLPDLVLHKKYGDMLILVPFRSGDEGAARSAVSLESAANPAPYGVATTLRAHVSTIDGLKPHGAVRFEGNGRTDVAIVGHDGTAMLDWPFDVGTTNIIAFYGGDEYVAPSTISTFEQRGVKAPTTTVGTTYRRLPSTSLQQTVTFSYGETVWLSTRTNPPSNSPPHMPTGTITIRSDGAVIATTPARDGTLLPILTWASFPVGQHVVTFEYSGDEHYWPSTRSLMITVTPGSDPTRGRAARH